MRHALFFSMAFTVVSASSAFAQSGPYDRMKNDDLINKYPTASTDQPVEKNPDVRHSYPNMRSRHTGLLGRQRIEKALQPELPELLEPITYLDITVFNQIIGVNAGKGRYKINEEFIGFTCQVGDETVRANPLKSFFDELVEKTLEATPPTPLELENIIFVPTDDAGVIQVQCTTDTGATGVTTVDIEDLR